MTRILIVRLGSIGDIVHAVPVAANLRAHDPSLEIEWVVESSLAPLVEMVTPVTRTIPIRTRVVRGAQGWLETTRALRARRYDAVLDVQGLVKSAVLARAAGGMRTIGLARAALREPAAALAYSTLAPVASGLHVIDRNLSALAALGVPVADPRAMPIDPGEPSQQLSAFLAETGPQTALLNPGANWPSKRWPPAAFAAVARHLAAVHQLVPIVTWGPGDEPLVDAIVEAAPGTVVAAPPTTLRGFLALARRARVIVSGDTGPLHLAAAVGTPIVGIFGPTNPRRNGPWDPRDVTVSRYYRCACHHKRACTAPAWCLAGIDAAEVNAAVDQRLGVPTG